MWLPLALADIAAWLTVIVRMNGDERTRSAIKVPDVSQKLREWCLPLLGGAMETDERKWREAARKERRGRMFDDLMELAKKNGAKVEVTNNG